MQADFNPFNAQQREHKEIMIRQLEDDDDDDKENNEDVNTKKTYVTTEGCKKEKDSKH